MTPWDDPRDDMTFAECLQWCRAWMPYVTDDVPEEWEPTLDEIRGLPEVTA